MITAADNGEAGDNIAVTILRSASNDDLYSIVVEQQQPDASYTVLGTVAAVTNASVQEAVANTGRPRRRCLGRPVHSR